MKRQDLKKFKLPVEPGIYLFKQEKTVLYVGKAASLQDRVRSYFALDLAETRGPAVAQMVEMADGLDFVPTGSVLEALILEAREIKRRQPKYNTKEKSDKSFNFVVITKEPWPRIMLKRERELAGGEKKLGFEIGEMFGPFPRGTELKEALKIIRKIFPYRDKCVPGTGKPCFNRQIGLCPGVCDGTFSRADYAQRIKEIKTLLNGNFSGLLRTLKKEMATLAKEKKFEKAISVRNRVRALEHIKDISLLKNDYRPQSAARVEAYDVAHTSGTEMVGVMVVVENGVVNKDEYRKFKIKTLGEGRADDTAALKEILRRRLAHSEWPLGEVLVADGGRAQLRAMEKVCAELGVKAKIVSVVKDEYHRAREILGDREAKKIYEAEILLANAEAHRYALSYHRQRRGKMI